MVYPDLLILRHGETEWNRAGRLQGEKDSPLTATGRAQAAAQGRLLERFGIDMWTLYTSPQGRSVATASIALGPEKKDVRLDHRLSEIALGAWTGRTRKDIAAEVPQLFETHDDLNWYDHAPGGEGLDALYDRTGAFLADLDGPAVIFTHGITSRMLRCHALGFEPTAFSELTGGQGVIYHLSEGVQSVLSEGG